MLFSSCFKIKSLGLWGCLLVLCSCQIKSSSEEKSENLQVAEAVQRGMVSDTDNQPVCEKGLLVHDSLRFTDGSVAVYRFQGKPGYGSVKYTDSWGRILATSLWKAGQLPQTWMYRYDAKGQLVYLIQILHQTPLHKLADACHEADKSVRSKCLLDFLRTMQQFDPQKCTKAQAEIVHLIYASDGRLISVQQLSSGYSIQAPVGYQINFRLQQRPLSLTNHIAVDNYWMEINMVKTNLAQKDYMEKRWVNFTPTLERYYRNNHLYKVVLYPNKQKHPADVPKTITFETRSDTTLILIKGRGCRHTFVHKYLAGTPCEYRYVSDYGTVLERRTYHYTNTGKVIIKKYKYKYSVKKLLLQEVVSTDARYIVLQSERIKRYIADQWSDYYSDMR